MSSFHRIEQRDPESIMKIAATLPHFKFNSCPISENFQVIERTLLDETLENHWMEQGCYCPVCFSVSRDLALFACLDEKNVSENDDIYICWHVVLRELVAAAEKQCIFCSFMLCEFFNDPSYSFRFKKGQTAVANPIICCAQNPEVSKTKALQEAIDRIRGICDKLQKDTDPWFDLFAKPTDYRAEDGKYSKIRFQVAYSSLNDDEILDILGMRREIVLDLYSFSHASDAFLKGYAPEVDLAGDYSLQYTRNWIAECVNQHTECPKLVKARLPTRVVEILSENEVRLFSGPMEDFYTILSYCWGGAQIFATTQETIKSRELGFQRHDLPPALQDAITVTTNMGLKYLWIDSLCIIQDSEQDKERELALMASYYKNSFLTICVGGDTCMENFLVKRGECTEHPGHDEPAGLLPFCVVGVQAQSGKVLFGKECLYAWSEEPVMDRAWTLQEYVLSPRALMYGTRLLWHCNSAQHSAGGTQECAIDARSFDHTAIRAQVHRSVVDGDNDNISPKEVDSVIELWYQIVREYSYREMSFKHDMLPALSALANEFQKILQDEYLAGLWRRNFLEGLMWSTYPDLNPTRSTPWRAPSWSWASCEGVVSYDGPRFKDATQVAKVVNCETVPKSTLLPNGEIKSAQLKIRGFLIGIPQNLTMKLLEQNNQGPSLEDSWEWRSKLIDMTKRDADKPPGSRMWQVPDNHVLLVLFVEPYRRDNVEKPTPEGHSTEKFVTLSVKPQDSSSDIRKDARETKETAGETGEQPKNQEDTQEFVILSGLVLTPVGDGKYERVARFTDLRIDMRVYACFPSSEITPIVTLV